MQKREAKLQIRFKHWLQSVGWSQNAAFELKNSKTNTLPKGSLKEHQRQALWNAKHSMLYHKIADTSYTPLPFDSFILSSAHAYIVVQFPLGVVMIDIDDYGEPLHYERAIKIGKRIF